MKFILKLKKLQEKALSILYLTGCFIIRKYRKNKKKIVLATCKTRTFIKKYLSKIYIKNKNSLLNKINSKKIKINKAKQEISGLSFEEKLTLAANKIWAARISLFQYSAPILSAFLLIYCVNHFNAKTWAIMVEYDDNVIGYVNSENDFIKAQRDVEQRIVNEEYIAPEKPNTKFTLMSVAPEQVIDSFSLSNQIIKASGNEIEDASGLYVDGKFLGAVKEPNALLATMDSILEPYRKDNPEAKVSFANKIELKEGLYPVSGVVDLNKLNNVISSEIEGETLYTVEEGDSPWAISDKTDVPYQQLLSLNPNIKTKLMPGQEVVLSQAKSYLDVKITKEETHIESIAYDTEKVSDSKALKGFSAIVKEGIKGEKEVVSQTTYINGKAISSEVISEKIIKEPKSQVVSYGTNVLSNSQASSTALMWPVYGGKWKITCGWYGYSGHKAIDMASSYGTPIMAAASGTVVMAANSYTGYGRYIIIDHGSGVQTLYAHNSQLLVKPGDKVLQGQVIAKMGSTGNSSGNHCHFEVRIYGRYVNPINYLP